MESDSKTPDVTPVVPNGKKKGVVLEIFDGPQVHKAKSFRPDKGQAFEVLMDRERRGFDVKARLETRRMQLKMEREAKAAAKQPTDDPTKQPAKSNLRTAKSPAAKRRSAKAAGDEETVTKSATDDAAK